KARAARTTATDAHPEAQGAATRDSQDAPVLPIHEQARRIRICTALCRGKGRSEGGRMKKRGLRKAWLLAPAFGLGRVGGCTTADLELRGMVTSLAADIHYLTSDDLSPRGQSRYYDTWSDSVRCGHKLTSGKHGPDYGPDYGHGHGRKSHRGDAHQHEASA